MNIDHLITPYKLGKPVLTGSGAKGSYDELAVDCPTVFQHNGRFYMAHVGFDGNGYQTGLAVSDDLVHWERPFDHPVLPVNPQAWDSVFASDPQVVYDSREHQWVMFYYGLGNLSACDGVAVSQDLYHWTKFPAPILTIGGPHTIDSKYAHKPFVIWHDGALYHYYCACRPSQEGDPASNGGEFRCISVARSMPW